MSWSDDDRRFMQLALDLAAQARGAVEPNPLVGCLVVAEGRIVGQGLHGRYGGPHAEVEALRQAGESARGATAYVTLEPCCHHGKTPPCTDALLAAGVRRVVAAVQDPFPQVAGGGLQRLQSAGIEVSVGLLADESRYLNAPYWKLVTTGSPWVIAKWAMSLDGRIATCTGDSRWISNDRSRALVHQLRGRMDAILVGRRTAELDNPLLTARPPGPRTPLRIVLDSAARLATESQLVQTAHQAPVMVVVHSSAPAENRQRLQAAGCEVLVLDERDLTARLRLLLVELGQRRLTNLLVEGGAITLGAFHDGGLIDELQVFIAPKVIGGGEARSPISGMGIRQMADARRLEQVALQEIDGDVLISARFAKASC